MFLTGIKVIFCAVLFLIFLQFSWYSFFSMALSSSLFLLKGTDKHIQTNKQSWTHTHALNYSFSCCWLILWLTNYPRRQQRRQQRWKQRNCCLFHRFHCFISGFRFPCACLLECERASLRVSMPTVSLHPTGVCFLIERQSESKSTTCVCLSLLSLSLTNTHYLTLVRVLSAIRNTLIKIIKNCTKLTTN